MNGFKNIYAGKRVLITGHTGFKGSWLSLWLKELGAEVTGYALAPQTDPSLFDALGLGNKVRHYTGNILDVGNLEKAFAACKPDIVFHLAAQPLVRFSYKEPRLTYETNVMGTVNVLEAVRKNPAIRACVVITTDKCYENREWVYGYRENDPMGGYDPYSSSKGCAELVVSAYRNSFFNPASFGKTHNTALASARAGNVIGGGDWSEDRLVPDAVKAIAQNETVRLRNPAATRPWQHVLEPLSGYLRLGERMVRDGKIFCEGWNFGPHDESVVNVESVIKQIISVWGKGAYTVDQGPQSHEANLLKLDISKAQAHLGWKPVYDIGTAVRETVEWYKQFYDGADMTSFTRKQIQDYVQEAVRKKEEWAL